MREEEYNFSFTHVLILPDCYMGLLELFSVLYSTSGPERREYGRRDPSR
jgi:hypothetical protein